MKRSICLQLVSFAFVVSAATTVNACCLFPFLNPFNWGCGYGHYGYGYGGHGCGYGGHGGCWGHWWGAPAWGGYQPAYGYNYYPGAYAPTYAPAVSSAAGCDCTASTGQYGMAGQMPVAGHQPSYQSAWQTVPQMAYQPQMAQPSVYSAPNSYTTYSPGYTSQMNAMPMGTVMSHDSAYAAPQFSYPQAMAPAQMGDIAGDHEYPSTSGLTPVIPNSYTQGVQIRPATYRPAPRSVRRYSSSVR
jgi:hypothetical protein